MGDAVDRGPAVLRLALRRENHVPGEDLETLGVLRRVGVRLALLRERVQEGLERGAVLLDLRADSVSPVASPSRPRCPSRPRESGGTRAGGRWRTPRRARRTCTTRGARGREGGRVTWCRRRAEWREGPAQHLLSRGDPLARIDETRLVWTEWSRKPCSKKPTPRRVTHVSTMSTLAFVAPTIAHLSSRVQRTRVARSLGASREVRVVGRRVRWLRVEASDGGKLWFEQLPIVGPVLSAVTPPRVKQAATEMEYFGQAPLQARPTAPTPVLGASSRNEVPIYDFTSSATSTRRTFGPSGARSTTWSWAGARRAPGAS